VTRLFLPRRSCPREVTSVRPRAQPRRGSAVFGPSSQTDRLQAAVGCGACAHQAGSIVELGLGRPRAVVRALFLLLRLAHGPYTNGLRPVDASKNGYRQYRQRTGDTPPPKEMKLNPNSRQCLVSFHIREETKRTGMSDGRLLLATRRRERKHSGEGNLQPDILTSQFLGERRKHTHTKRARAH